MQKFFFPQLKNNPSSKIEAWRENLRKTDSCKGETHISIHSIYIYIYIHTHTHTHLYTYINANCIKCIYIYCTQSCLTLYDFIDCRPPGSSSMEFSRQEYFRGFFPPRVQTLITCVSSIGRQILYHCTT